MSTPFVRAVLVTDGRTDHLPAFFAAFEAVAEVPPRLEVVLVNGAEVDIPASLAVTIARIDSSSYAESLTAIVGSTAPREGELLWLLHDDSAPSPGMLDALVAASAKRPRAAVIGPAHVRWTDSSRLISLGTTVSRVGARRVGLVVEDDINQGQHDWREDVMAVSLAGALVRRDAWDALGGLDAGYRGYGDSLELCRRAWAAGWDVVVVPHALLRHAQDGLHGLRTGHGDRASTHATRRTSEWHHALAWAPWWASLFVAVLIPLSALARFPIRIAQNVPRVAFAELAVPFLVLTRAASIASTVRGRYRAKATGRIDSRLFASARQVVDAVRQRELGSLERSRAARAQSEMVRAEAERAAGRQRLGLWVTVVVAAAAAVALSARWVGEVGSGAMLSAPGLGASDVSLGTVWARTWTGWSDTGLGGPGIDGAFAGLMLPLALVPGGMRVGIAVLLSAAPLAAALWGWWAAGHATRGPWIRVAAAVVWALWPPFLAAIADGRVGPVLAHLALAAAAIAAARATGWRRGELIGGGEELAPPAPSASASLAGALALTVATIAQPVLLLPVVLLVAVLGARAGRLRWRVWSMAGVPLMLGAPGLVAAARHLDAPTVALSIIAREPGPGATFEGSIWMTALGAADPARWAGDLRAAWPLGVAAAGVVAVLAVAGLASRRAARPASWGLAIAGLGVGVSAWSASATAAWADGAGHGAISGWPGTGSSLVALGGLIAALSAHGAALPRVGARFAVARTVGAAAATLAVGASLGATVMMALPSSPRGSLTTADPHVLPLAVPLDQSGAARQRVLVLADAGGTVSYDVLTTDGDTLLVGRADVGPDGAPLDGGGATVGIDALAEAVAAASVSGAADLSPFVAWGIGTIVVAPGGDRIAGALDQNGQVSLAGGSERGRTYRLNDGGVERAWIEAPDGEASPLESGATWGETAAVPAGGGTLVIAVPASAGWTAQADGVELEPIDDVWGRASFAVPAGAQHVNYSYRDPLQRWWWWASAFALAWALVGSVPLRRSKEVTA